jgi:hypothetical protein
VRLSTRRQFSTVSNASSILTSSPNYADSPLASAVRPGGSLQAAHQELDHLLELSLPFAEVRRDRGYRQPGGVSRRGGPWLSGCLGSTSTCSARMTSRTRSCETASEFDPQNWWTKCGAILGVVQSPKIQSIKGNKRNGHVAFGTFVGI